MTQKSQFGYEKFCGYRALYLVIDYQAFADLEKAAYRVTAILIPGNVEEQFGIDLISIIIISIGTSIISGSIVIIIIMFLASFLIYSERNGPHFNRGCEATDV